jgi:hypothetical protein
MTVTEQELDEFRTEVSAWMRDNKPADPGFLLPQSFMEVGELPAAPELHGGGG